MCLAVCVTATLVHTSSEEASEPSGAEVRALPLPRRCQTVSDGRDAVATGVHDGLSICLTHHLWYIVHSFMFTLLTLMHAGYTDPTDKASEILQIYADLKRLRRRSSEVVFLDFFSAFATGRQFQKRRKSSFPAMLLRDVPVSCLTSFGLS